MRDFLISILNGLPISYKMKRDFMRLINGGEWTPVIKGVNTLRDFPVDDLEDGFVVNLAYHTASIFGGGGLFVWKVTEIRPDNNGTIIAPTGHVGPGRWMRMESLHNPGFVNVTWFGARVNSPGFNNGAIFNRASQSLPLYSGTGLVISPQSDGSPSFMRAGTVYAPPGSWHTSETIVISGGSTLHGDGPQKTNIVLNENSPGFESYAPKEITEISFSAPMTVYYGTTKTLHLKVPGHGKPVGSYTSGFIQGITHPTPTVAMPDIRTVNFLNSWQIMHVIDEDTLRVLWGIGVAGDYVLDSAQVELDCWVVDYQQDWYNISPNNTFGSVIHNLQIVGSAPYNLGCSGLHIEGAQQSYLYNVTITSIGQVGGAIGVAADKLWCASSIRGPGYMCNTGPCMENGLIHSEHHNQSGEHTLRTWTGEIIPRPAFYIRGSNGWRCRQAQGEDSTWEFVIDNSIKVTVDKFGVNGPGTALRNGHRTTLLYITGDAYDYNFSETFFFGTFLDFVNDQSYLAIAHGDAGVKSNFADCMGRAGNMTYGHNLMLRGPYANDAAAAAKYVPINAAYRLPGGGIAWRTDIEPPSGAIPIYNHYAITQANYDLIAVPDPNTVYEIIP